MAKETHLTPLTASAIHAVALFEKEIASQAPILLIAEGLSGGKNRAAAWQQGIGYGVEDHRRSHDGTRSLMYQKTQRLDFTGVAPTEEKRLHSRY